MIYCFRTTTPAARPTDWSFNSTVIKISFDFYIFHKYSEQFSDILNLLLGPLAEVFEYW